MKRDYRTEFFAAVKNMKKAAIRKIRKYGVLDLREHFTKLLMEQNVFESKDDVDEDELDDMLSYNTYGCVYTDKHDVPYVCDITGVRYNEEKKCVEAYLESDYGEIDDWYGENRIGFGRNSIWLTILEFANN